MFQNGNVEVPQVKIFVNIFLKSLVYHIFENLTIRKFLRIWYTSEHRVCSELNDKIRFTSYSSFLYIGVSRISEGERLRLNSMDKPLAHDITYVAILKWQIMCVGRSTKRRCE